MNFLPNKMSKIFDVIVIGIGGIGSATCLSFAKRKVSILGLEQFDIAHSYGSSSGNTRLIRKAYFENENYIPLLNKSYELWDELEKETNEHLFHKSGLLIFGKSGHGIAFDKMQQTAQKYNISLKIHSHSSLKKNFPLFHTPKEDTGVFEENAGYLLVEKCIETNVKLSKQYGAELHFNEKVNSWNKTRNGFLIKTNKNEYCAKKLVFTGGAWSSQLLKDLNLPLITKRAPQFWFKSHIDFSKQPCFAFDLRNTFIFGFPSTEIGVKIAEYTPKEVIEDPYSLKNYPILKEDFINIQNCIKQYLPHLSQEPIISKNCMYTLTPDEDFLIDLHPHEKDISIFAGCSGHAFKFAPLIGECLADLTLHGETQIPIDFLRYRF